MRRVLLRMAWGKAVYKPTMGFGRKTGKANPKGKKLYHDEPINSDSPHSLSYLRANVKKQLTLKEILHNPAVIKGMAQFTNSKVALQA